MCHRRSACRDAIAWNMGQGPVSGVPRAGPDRAFGGVRPARDRGIPDSGHRLTDRAAGRGPTGKGTDDKDRVGCTEKGKQGNLAGTCKVRSHKWLTKCCPAEREGPGTTGRGPHAFPGG